MSPDTHFVRALIFPIKQLLASLLLLCVVAPSIGSAVADSDILYVCDASTPCRVHQSRQTLRRQYGLGHSGREPRGRLRSARQQRPRRGSGHFPVR